MDLFKCSKCGADLLIVGITEVTVGGITECAISFGKSEEGEKMCEFDVPDIRDFDDSWITCNNCNAELRDRSASDVIDAYELDNAAIMQEAI